MTSTGQRPSWRTYIPISFWIASYEKGFLATDLIAALTVWALGREGAGRPCRERAGRGRRQ